MVCRFDERKFLRKVIQIDSSFYPKKLTDLSLSTTEIRYIQLH